MKIPRLNRRLTLEAPQKAPDGAGGFVTVWNPLGTIWAELRPRSGGERGINGAPVSRVSYRITVRAAPQGSPQRPAPDARYRDGTRLFNIRAVTEMDPQGLYLVCFADEEVVA